MRWKGMFTARILLKTHHFDVGLERKAEGATHCLMGNNAAKHC